LLDTSETNCGNVVDQGLVLLQGKIIAAKATYVHSGKPALKFSR
jgi:hypothetical protein